MQTAAMWVIGVAGLLEVAAAWWMVRALRAHQQLDGRMAHLADALSLLTETTEAGFKAAAAEIGRLADAAPRAGAAPRAAANRRVATARGRGRSVEQIAADEGMAVGEVGLRLRLHEAARAGQPCPKAERPKRRRTAAAAAQA